MINVHTKVMHKYSLILTVVLLVSSMTSLAQLSGPTNATVNNTYTYTYYSGSWYLDYPNWQLNGAGTVMNQWSGGSSYSGYYYYADIKWTSTGSKTATIANYSEPLASITVNVCFAASVPTVLAASNITDNSFTANWNITSGASTYRLDVSTTSSFSTFVSGYNNLLVNSTSRSVTGLAAGTAYYYRVRAANCTGTASGNSSTISVLTVPAPPSPNSASSITAISFTANWSASASAISYRLDVSTTSSFSSFVTGYNNLTVSSTSQSVTGLSEGTTYYYRVRAVNGSGISGNSGTASVLTFPSAPVAGGATSITASSFTANWGGVASATSYQLDVSSSSSFSSFVPGYNNLSVGTTSQNITGLSAGTTYYYRVRAVNGSGASGNSGPANVVTVPPPPVLAGATSITATSFIANWLSAAGASSYRLDVSTNSSFSTFVSGYNNLIVNSTNQNVTGLNAGTMYYYRVRAVNGSGTSSNSITGSVLTIPSAPSANPPTDVTSTSFTANWGSVASATSYLLDVSTSAAFSSFVTGYNNLSVSTTSQSVTGLAGGATYYYRVRAVNGTGTSASSGTITVLTAPPPPSANPGSSITATSFTANWSAATSATGYRLDVSTNSSFSSFVTGFNDLPVSSTSQSVTGLAAGTTYYYRVRAVNASGTSGSSGTVTVLTLAAGPVATAASNISAESLTANWESVPSATSYRLDVAPNNTFSTFISGFNDLSVGANSQSVTGLAAGTSYYYRVRAVNGSGTSGNSNTIGTLTLPAAPVPTGATNVTSGSFIANWQSVVSATSYQLDVSESSSFSTFLTGYQNLSVTATSQDVSGLLAGTTYYYRVRAVNGSGVSQNSSVFLVIGAPVLNAVTDITTSSFTVSWGSVESATGYRLDISDNSSFSTFVTGYNNLSVASTGHAVSGLNAGSSYYCRVRTENANGTSGNSNIVSVVTIPPTPVANAGGSIAEASFTANWSATLSATGYQLDVSTSTAFTTFVTGYDNLSVASTSAFVSGLTGGTTYYYRVRAVNGSGVSLNSSTITVLTLPAAPVANAGSSISASSFTASWSAVASASGYRLDVSTSSSFATFIAGYNNLSLTTTSRSITGLAAGVTYYYRVRGVNATGTSANSNTRSVLIRPAAPVANAATSITTTTFLASWNAVTSATSYRLDVSVTSAFSSFVTGYNNLVVSTTSRSVTGLIAGTTYYYRVRAINASGGSANSNIITIITVPAAPVAIDPTNIASTSFTANWQSVQSATGYLLDISESSTFSTFVTGYNGLSVTATSEPVTGLSLKTNYYYRVRAVNGSGTSGYSQTIAVTTDNFLPLYNGMITSMRWRTDAPYATTAGDLTGMYLFSYDDKYQVRMASWADYTLTSFTPIGDRFKVINPEYDPNGNIKKLQRYGASGLIQNNFSYSYNSRVPTDAHDNQLEQIDGYGTYHYNEIGQLEEELKNSGNQFIEYDVTGKVRKVYAQKNASTGALENLKVEYVYDDRGFRLAKINYEPAPGNTTWYVRDASGNLISVYEQAGAISYSSGVPQVNSQPLDQTEVPLYGSGKLGTFYPGQNGSTAYEITDHLGNVRALLRDNSNVYVATMEDNGEADYLNPRVEEMQYFENLFETEDENIYMNHTLPGVVAVPDKASYLYWVDGMTGMEASDKAVGPAIALRVRPGDVIDIETWVRFERKVTYSRDVLLTTLSSFLGNSFINQTGFEGMTAGQIGDNMNAALLGANYPNDGTDPSTPFAYLNYIVYDENLVFKNAGWQRVGDAAGFYPNEMGIMNDHQHLTFGSPITINEKGYIYIWVSNQSQDTKVWFDDLTIRHSGVYVTQATDYGVWGDVIREKKTDDSFYRFGYQGQFSERDTLTGWNHFELREYDPIIGRWISTDPFGQYWSPYKGMGNNPIGIVDPDGGFDGPGDMELEYELAMQQMDYNLYDEISMTGSVYLANDVTIKPNISDYALDVLWVYSQVYDPELYANAQLKAIVDTKVGARFVAPIGVGGSLTKDGFDWDPITPQSGYMSYVANDYLEYRFYPAEGKKAIGEDAYHRILVTVHRLKFGAIDLKAQGDFTTKHGNTYLGGRAVGEWTIKRGVSSIEVSIGGRVKYIGIPRLWTLLP